jgi:hypothetical protein
MLFQSENIRGATYYPDVLFPTNGRCDSNDMHNEASIYHLRFSPACTQGSMEQSSLAVALAGLITKLTAQITRMVWTFS